MENRLKELLGCQTTHIKQKHLRKKKKKIVYNNCGIYFILLINMLGGVGMLCTLGKLIEILQVHNLCSECDFW